MIGAMPAVAVRHERRKKKSKDKRPKKLLLKPYQGGQNDGTMSPGSGQPSRVGSRAGSPTHGNQNGIESVDDLDGISVHYGDECFYGKVSLLHFVIFFLLGGLTVLIVGLVQLKKEASLNFFKYKIIISGGVLMGLGLLLLIIKCIFFRKPLYYDDDDEDEMMAEKEAANAIERKAGKSAESKNGGGSKHPHLAITITPASDASQQSGVKSPSKGVQKETENCTKEEIEALTSSGDKSDKVDGDLSDNRNNIKMQQIKNKSSETSKNIITASEKSTSSKTNKDPSAV